MTAERKSKVAEILAEALRLPPAERDAYITAAAAGDQELANEVRSLLIAVAGAEGFLANPTARQDHLTTGPLSQASAPITEGPGTRIGPYKLLQRIGEGGFGSVFMAEQEKPIRRRVALKIIKLGMDTRHVIARFEAERQALAMMDHPNIARVLDVGATETGRPYFVMELVKGDPIHAYCDRNKLSIDQRLELFMQVCFAVQHAHTKGIIHRDIKPSNVLVTTQDDKPFAKVIDFGIAKATDHRLTEKTLFTEHRALIGTPEYMSPEQAEGSLDIDTRTDVYSLGVLLYELLTGVTPFEPGKLRGAAFAEIQRIIRDVEPPKPSTRISQTPDTLLTVAAQRRTEPARLGALVRGELDWIVMKSLEKDRARRYESPSALALDVKRHLEGEAVVAAPPSTVYRVRKFVRRNRGPVIAVCAVTAALCVGVVGTSWQWNVARRANLKLLDQRDRAEAGVGQMMGILTGRSTLGPLVSTNEDGIRLGEDDPLGYAIGFGIQLAESLKEDRDALAATNAQLLAQSSDSVNSLVKMYAALDPDARVELKEDRITFTNPDGTGGFLMLNMEGDWKRGITTVLPSQHLLGKALRLIEERDLALDESRALNDRLRAEDTRARLAETRSVVARANVAYYSEDYEADEGLNVNALRAAVGTLSSLLGDQDLEVADAFWTLACYYEYTEEDYSAAIKAILSAIDIRQRAVGGDDFETMSMMHSYFGFAIVFLIEAIEEGGWTSASADFLTDPNDHGLEFDLLSYNNGWHWQRLAYAVMLSRAGLLDRAAGHLAIFQRIQDSARIEGGRNAPGTWWTEIKLLGEWGMVDLALKDHASAESKFREALWLAAWELNYAPPSCDLVSSLYTSNYSVADWAIGSVADANAGLGVLSLRQSRYADAQPLLLLAHRLLSDSHANLRFPYLAEDFAIAHPLPQIERDLADLYERWDAAEPGKGYAEKAATWRECFEDPPTP